MGHTQQTIEEEMTMALENKKVIGGFGSTTVWEQEWSDGSINYLLVTSAPGEPLHFEEVSDRPKLEDA